MMPAITGNSEESFTISATIYYPQSAAGNNTVTCGGVLTLSNGTQVTGTTGTEKVTAVAVDSVALADSPQNVQIGQTLTRNDFTITTTPTGYGNYQDPETQAYLVSFSPPSIQVAIGDNLVTASCGVSSASLDLVGVHCSSSLGSESALDPDLGLIAVSFTAEILNDGGTYQISGGSAVGGDTSDILQAGVPFNGTVDIQLSSSGDATAKLTITPNSGSGGGTDNALTSFANSASSGGTSTIAKILVDTAPLVLWEVSWQPDDGQVKPAIATTLAWKTVSNAKFSNALIAAVASPTVSGNAIGAGYFLGHQLFPPLWTADPSCSVSLAPPNFWTTTNLINNAIESVETQTELTPGSQILFANSGGQAANPACITAPNGQPMTGTQMNNLTCLTKESLSGNYNLSQYPISAELGIPTLANGTQDLNNWAVDPQAEVDFKFTWN